MYYWQDALLLPHDLTIDKLRAYQTKPSTKDLDALLTVLESMKKPKIEETLNLINCINLETLINHRNKISTTYLIDIGKGHFKKDLDQIKEDIRNCSDNFVAYKKNDDFGKILFDIAVSNGCCGSSDFEVFHEDSIWFVHFNFGH